MQHLLARVRAAAQSTAPGLLAQPEGNPMSVADKQVSKELTLSIGNPFPVSSSSCIPFPFVLKQA